MPDKGIFGERLDVRDFAEVLHEIFIEQREYSVKGLAFFLGEDDSAVYKLIEGARPIKADTARRIIHYISVQNRKDTRLLDFFCGPAGFMAVPRVNGKHEEKIQAILVDIANLARGDGK